MGRCLHASRRLKNHKLLQEMARQNPNSENIFGDKVLDTFYPQIPATLEDVCLYDSLAKYEVQGIDTSCQRMYKKVTKPKLPNHKIFDPEKVNQRQDYFYSLVDERVSMLNHDQKRIFDNVKAHFLHQKIHEANQCSCDFDL